MIIVITNIYIPMITNKIITFYIYIYNILYTDIVGYSIPTIYYYYMIPHTSHLWKRRHVP